MPFWTYPVCLQWNAEALSLRLLIGAAWSIRHWRWSCSIYSDSYFLRFAELLSRKWVCLYKTYRQRGVSSINWLWPLPAADSNTSFQLTVFAQNKTPSSLNRAKHLLIHQHLQRSLFLYFIPMIGHNVFVLWPVYSLAISCQRRWQDDQHWHSGYIHSTIESLSTFLKGPNVIYFVKAFPTCRLPKRHCKICMTTSISNADKTSLSFYAIVHWSKLTYLIRYHLSF